MSSRLAWATGDTVSMSILEERKEGENLHFEAITLLFLFFPSQLPGNVFSGGMRIKGEMYPRIWKELSFAEHKHLCRDSKPSLVSIPALSPLLSGLLVLRPGSPPLSSRMAFLREVATASPSGYTCHCGHTHPPPPRDACCLLAFLLSDTPSSASCPSMESWPLP